MAEDVFRIVGSQQADAYRVEDVVAEGGFAVVYRAYHEAFRAPVALKCLKVPGTLSGAHQAEFLERFREEAELLFRLSASIPTVVRPLHVGTVDSPTGAFVPFIALEWLDGRTLDTVIERRRTAGEPPLPLEEVVLLLTPVAAALERAHHFPGPQGTTSILHRDLKPENIFVADVHGERVVKILDFGIGKVKSVATQIVGKVSTQADTLSAFTPAYGAPEQWLPKRFGQTGPWTDVWGLALTLVEACVSHAPLEGDQAAIMGSAIDPARRPTPRSEGIATSDEVEAVFRKALAVDPRDRYHTVGRFWSELERAVRPSAESVPSSVVVSSSSPNPGSLPPDPMGRTRARPADGARSGSGAVPDLVLDVPAPKPTAAPVAKPRAPERITVDRGGSTGRSAGSAAGSLQYFGNTFDDLEDMDDLAGPSRPVGGGRGLELDGVGVSPQSAPIRPTSAHRAAPVALPVRPIDYKTRFETPVKLVLLGVVIMAADLGYAHFVGESLHVGPARPFWVAGPLVLVGVAMAVVRLVAGDDP